MYREGRVGCIVDASGGGVIGASEPEHWICIGGPREFVEPETSPGSFLCVTISLGIVDAVGGKANDVVVVVGEVRVALSVSQPSEVSLGWSTLWIRLTIAVGHHEVSF